MVITLVCKWPLVAPCWTFDRVQCLQWTQKPRLQSSESFIATRCCDRQEHVRTASCMKMENKRCFILKFTSDISIQTFHIIPFHTFSDTFSTFSSCHHADPSAPGTHGDAAAISVLACLGLRWVTAFSHASATSSAAVSLMTGRMGGVAEGCEMPTATFRRLRWGR